MTTNHPAALAAAREALADIDARGLSLIAAERTTLIDTMRDLLAAIDAQKPVAWQFRDDNGEWRNFLSDKHRVDTEADGRWQIRALYAAPPAAVPAPVVWHSHVAVVVNPGKSVELFIDGHLRANLPTSEPRTVETWVPGEPAPPASVPVGYALVNENDIRSLVAGPFMHHHKMNELQDRVAKGFDRCRELTLENVAEFFAKRAAAQKENSND